MSCAEDWSQWSCFCCASFFSSSTGNGLAGCAMTRIRKVVITAAVWATRFLPATKSQPEEMPPLIEKPLIQFAVEDAAASGIGTVVVVTALGTRAIEGHFDQSFEL